MPLQNIQRSDPILQSSWDSGMITSLPPEELPEDAAVLIENFEFDGVGNLSARELTQTLFTTAETASITSIFVARYSSGTEKVYYTIGNKLFSINLDGTGNSDITGAFSFPNGFRWYWVMFDDFAIGIMGSTTQRPIKIDSAGTVTTLNASAPFAAHGVVWNSRLWLSGSTSSTQSTIFGSAINDPEDWTTTGDAGAITLGIDIGSGQKIHALSVFRGNLFVYKENRIHVVTPISAPATIPSNLRVDIYTNNLGCKQPLTIQDVLDDQLFLSNAGVTSLSLAPLGNIGGAILSNNIKELGQLRPGGETLDSHGSSSALNVSKKQQYWITVSTELGAFSRIVYVMDYSDIAQKNAEGLPKVRWCRFVGDVYGASYIEVVGSASGDSTYYLIGQRAPGGGVNTAILKYIPNTTSPNYTGTLLRRIITRAFSGGSPLIRSLWHRMGIGIAKLTSTVVLEVKYYYDGFLTEDAGTYSHTFDSTIANTNRFFWRSFKKNDSGRKANLVQLEISGNTANQAFTIKSINLEKTELNHRRSTTKWVSD